MSDTTYVDFVTPVPAVWLNDINNTVYRVLGSGGAVPTTVAQLLTNIGVTTKNNPVFTGTATFGTGSTGMTLQPAIGGSIAAVYSTALVPGTTNYSLSFDQFNTALNGVTSSRLRANGSDILVATATGAAVTGTLSSTGSITMGSGITGSVMQPYTGTGASALYNGSVVPGNLNYSILSNGTATVINGTVQSAMFVNGNNILLATSTGASITGSLTVSGLVNVPFADNPWMRLGECLVDQRNNGAAYTITAGAAAVYTLDGWQASCTGANVTVQQVAGTLDYLKVIQVTGAASVTAANLIVKCESKDIARFNNQATTVMVEMSNSLLTSCTWTASYANAVDNFSAVTQIATGTITGITASLTQFTFSIPASANIVNGLQIQFSVGAQTSGTWVVTGLDQVAGTQSRNYPHRKYSEVLAACQRYLPVLSAASTSDYFAQGGTTSTSAGQVTVPWVVSPRILPTGITISNVSHFTFGTLAGTSSTATAVTYSASTGFRYGWLSVTGTGTPYTANQPAALGFNNTAGQLIFTGAEL